MVTFIAVGSAILMWVLGLFMLTYAGMDYAFLKRGGAKQAMKSGLFCIAWGFALIAAWLALLFL